MPSSSFFSLASVVGNPAVTVIHMVVVALFAALFAALFYPADRAGEASRSAEIQDRKFRPPF
ncbi:hypothetical protein [Undibacterium sp.]|uniref:hypothetical protein n=1 Tax=Undibacterium sp. TaxID=1914977 RepID=UPI002CB7AD39|nr:hypothetical protein [Undibacterium sp.]HTD02442.1 hypothetical protein [Undibacterium sp.]